MTVYTGRLEILDPDGNVLGHRDGVRYTMKRAYGGSPVTLFRCELRLKGAFFMLVKPGMASHARIGGMTWEAFSPPELFNGLGTIQFEGDDE